MRKILIVGASSKIAEAIVRNFQYEDSIELSLISLNAGNLRYDKSIRRESVNYLHKKLIKDVCYSIAPDVIINCAALTDVDACEGDKNTASLINEKLVENLARISSVIESKLITFSTDYVFNGQFGPYTEEAQPDPINYYGKSKHAGENACATNADNYAIIRTNVIYGLSLHGKKNFIDWLVGKFEAGEPFSVVKGQWCNPTLSDDIAVVVGKIIDKNRIGIYHAAGSDWVNRYEIALAVAKTYDYDTELVQAVDSSSLKQKAKRPEKAGLVTLKAETDLNMKFSSLASGLEVYKFQMEEKGKTKYRPRIL